MSTVGGKEQGYMDEHDRLANICTLRIGEQLAIVWGSVRAQVTRS